ncbi:hypothetical protein Pmani_023177 [Petrolisthes manimaculis]|uniref:Uncharacterized protein n=1 Tax=Petrolisthes manimaculis TaxID=1843537 RepID=A0AAE1U3J9_9EUCA|nr:hypothetical protein Pmani_023177 [Petrolisthes manimaculis]
MIKLTQRVSHKIWRVLVKRERRRRGRQKQARERERRLLEEEATLMNDPSYVAELERQKKIEEDTQRLVEEEASRQKLEWQLRDAALHSLFLRNKQKTLIEQQQREKQEALIKKEWEEKLQKEKEEEKKKEKQRALLAAASGTLSKEGEETHNPEPPAGYSCSDFTPQRRELCPFFIRTGACRFGINCSREHTYPEVSRIILLPKMYSYFGLEHVAMEDVDADIALEYSESETYQHFKDFFEDTLPEFQRFGNVIQYKVCSNMSMHLRGNVYVEYSREEDARCAQLAFNGRWYAGKQLTCLLVHIERWRSAICGLYWHKRCPKGGQCNLLHAYRNPNNAFWRADQDLHQAVGGSSTPLHSSHGSHSERSSKHGSNRKRRSQSTSRAYVSRSRMDVSGSRQDKHRSARRSRSRDGCEPDSSRSVTRRYIHRRRNEGESESDYSKRNKPRNKGSRERSDSDKSRNLPNRREKTSNRCSKGSELKKSKYRSENGDESESDEPKNRAKSKKAVN